MISLIESKIWAKTCKDGSEKWHPLILHMLDVAACVDAVLAREPESTRSRMAAVFGMTWEDARSWILLIVACHDLGKACPGFQCKWKNMTDFPLPRIPDTNMNHAFVSQITLAEILRDLGWPDDLADLVADAVGCHHGSRASPSTLNNLEYNRNAIGKNDWELARKSIVEALFELFEPSRVPDKKKLSGPDFMLLSGLTSFADWIGSNEDWFEFGTPEDCDDLQAWFDKRRKCANDALNAIGWGSRTPLSDKKKSFQEVFEFQPRPLQKAVADALVEVTEPAIILIEAPMGEGKTEAAFFAHLELQRCFGHRGLYVALPTKATGNAMFLRTLKFLRGQGMNRPLDLQLLHGATLLNDTFQDLHASGIHDETTGGEVKAGEWFTQKKRALLSEYGVGTVDQALLSILPVRHNFVRLWGLANRVVVFDEIHAYDAYTGTLLIHSIRWLLALGSSVVLLSATLPPRFRRKLAELVNDRLPSPEQEYPRLTLFQPGSVRQRHFNADPERRQTIKLQSISPDLSGICSALEEHLVNGGMGLALVNTVQRAQDLYQTFPQGEPIEINGQIVGKHLADGTDVYLFHARFPADKRQQREELALENFDADSKREGRKILIATQVVEQSLDLDFDVMATDLAPIDLVLQRAGRLWRHKREYRPMPEPVLIVAGLTGDTPPDFEDPLWWGAVYREDFLIRTWCLLSDKPSLVFPDEIDTLVQEVYEERVEIPEFLEKRLNKALCDGEGGALGEEQQAHIAFIGLPNDASWNDPGRFNLYDEDDPDVHRTLKVQTRLGEESVVAIPLYLEDNFDPVSIPNLVQAKQWYLRAVNISRLRVVKNLKKPGVPEGWKKSSLLRNCLPLLLDQEGQCLEDTTVRLDDELGLIYKKKENE